MNEAVKRLYLEYNSPAPRNRTLFLTEADRQRYANFPSLDELRIEGPFSALLDRIYHGDCMEGMALSRLSHKTSVGKVATVVYTERDNQCQLEVVVVPSVVVTTSE